MPIFAPEPIFVLRRRLRKRAFDAPPYHKKSHNQRLRDLLQFRDSKVTRWLRPASSQFNIYWSNGSKRYEPDFVVETEKEIYMVETKAAKDVTSEDVQAKKKAAETYCENASEYTRANGGKPWRYVLLAHDKVDRTSSFDYLVVVG